MIPSIGLPTYRHRIVAVIVGTPGYVVKIFVKNINFCLRHYIHLINIYERVLEILRRPKGPFFKEMV